MPVLRSIRERFGLDLRQAKEVMLQTEGTAPSLAEHEAKVLEAIRNTAFGTIEIVIHQSKIVQLTRSEKVRFEQI